MNVDENTSNTSNDIYNITEHNTLLYRKKNNITFLVVYQLRIKKILYSIDNICSYIN